MTKKMNTINQFDSFILVYLESKIITHHCVKYIEKEIFPIYWRIRLLKIDVRLFEKITNKKKMTPINGRLVLIKAPSATIVIIPNCNKFKREYFFSSLKKKKAVMPKEKNTNWFSKELHI